MSAVSLLLSACLCGGPPPAQVPRGVVVDVFPDGTLLVSVGRTDDAKVDDDFSLVRGGSGRQVVGPAELTAVGTTYSLARVTGVPGGNAPKVGDRLVDTRWEKVRARERVPLGGGAFIDRPDR
jgi:hypothetical protein